VKIDLPHVVTDSDRHGNVRIYVRVKGRPKVRIRSAPGTAAFLGEYRAAVDGVTPPRRVGGERRPELQRGTLAWLGRQYFSSTEFLLGLEAQTQRTRRAILEQCFSEAVREGSVDIMGDCPLPLVSAAHARRLRDLKGDKPGAARNRVKALKVIFGWGVERGLCDLNPPATSRRACRARRVFTPGRPRRSRHSKTAIRSARALAWRWRCSPSRASGAATSSPSAVSICARNG
jgi:hypothetical protein